jgi:hypothetical protein
MIHAPLDRPPRLTTAARSGQIRETAITARTRRIGKRVRRALGVLKAFSLRLPNGPLLSIGVDAVSGPADELHCNSL